VARRLPRAAINLRGIVLPKGYPRSRDFVSKAFPKLGISRLLDILQEEAERTVAFALTQYRSNFHFGGERLAHHF